LELRHDFAERPLLLGNDKWQEIPRDSPNKDKNEFSTKRTLYEPDCHPITVTEYAKNIHGCVFKAEMHLRVRPEKSSFKVMHSVGVVLYRTNKQMTVEHNKIFIIAI
jgi:hypothetical protein